MGRLFVAAMLVTHVFFLWTVREGISRGGPDFTVFYTAAKILAQGHGAQLYDAQTQRDVQRQFAFDPELRRGPLPYIHPAFEALIFLPLTFLPYGQAFAVWCVLNLAVLLGVSALLKDSFAFLGTISIAEIGLACLAFFPVFANFHQGQDSLLLLLVVLLAFRAVKNQKLLAAGCWLGCGIFKYHLILPLMVLLTVWKGRKLILGFALTSAVAGVLSVALTGWRGALMYPAFTWQVISRPGFGRIPFEQIPNLMGLAAGWGSSENPGLTLQVAVLVSSVALLIFVGRRLRVRDSSRLAFAAAVVSCLLVGYSTNTYDLALLVLPLCVVGEHCLSPEPQAGSRLALILPILPLLISPLWFFLWMSWHRINLMALFLLWWVFAIEQELARLKSNAAMPASVSRLA